MSNRARFLILSVALFISTAAQAQDGPPAQSDFKINILYTGRLLGYYRQDLTGDQKQCLKDAELSHTPSRNCSGPERRAALISGGNANASLDRACHDMRETIDQTPGGEPPPRQALGRVAAFWCSQRDKQAEEEQEAHKKMERVNVVASPILLSMGDDLAPELGSRLRRSWWNGSDFEVTSYDPGWHLLPEKAFDFPFRPISVKGAPVALVDEIHLDKARMAFAAEDNVANFLLLSGYRAMVPGREDFLYGALWLQQLANKLSELADQDRTRATVRFLAANLRVAPVQPPLKNVAWVKPVTPSQSPCPLFFSPDLYRHLPPSAAGCKRDATTAAGDAQKNVGYTEIEVQDLAGKLHKIQVIALVDGGAAGAAPSGGSDLLREVSQDRKQFWGNGRKTQYEVIVTKPDQELQNILFETRKNDYDMRILMAQMPRSSAFQLASHYGRNHQACLQTQNGAEQVIPFDGDNRPQGCDPKDVSPLPAIDLVIAEAQDGLETGDEEATYFQDRDKQRTRAQVVAPYSAYPEDKLKSQTAHSGPPDKREPEVAGSERTDFLIDPISELRFERKVNDPDPQRLDRPVRVTYENRVPDIASTRLWHAQNMVSPFSAKSPDLADCGLQDDHHLAAVTTAPGATPDMAFEFCALRSLQLRPKAKSNVAMLQRRDFYFPNVLKQDDDSERSVCPSTAIADECLNAIMFAHFLWKDDTPALINLTGAQLKAVLSQSDALHQNDETSEVKDVDQEWLVMTGVVQAQKKTTAGGNATPAPSSNNITPNDLCLDAAAKEASDLAQMGIQLAQGKADSGKNSGTYCINGAPIDDAQLYKVITSQALARNEEVYPGISKIPPGEPALDDEVNIAQLFGPTLARAIQSNWSAGAAACSTKCPQDIPKLEEHQQERRVFHLSIQNLEASYSSYSPNVSNTDLASEFGGVADSRASSPSTRSVVLTDSVRALGEGRYLDFGFLQTLDFNFTKTGNEKGGLPTLSFSSNNFAVGPLVQLHLKSNLLAGPHWKGLPSWKITISPFLYQEQPRGNAFAFTFDGSSTLQRLFPAKRQQAFTNRIGLRHEFNDGDAHKPDKGSYYELGLEHNTYSRVLYEVDFLNGGLMTNTNCKGNPPMDGAPSCTPCPLLPGVTYAQCVQNAQNVQKKAATPATIIGPATLMDGVYTNLHTSGIYFDSILSKQLTRLKLPTNQSLSILFQGKGDYAFRHSYANPYATQAYYAFTSSFGLQIPVYSNLTVVPSYGAFFYENFNSYQPLIARSLTIDLRWTFDHHNPVRWKSDLSYTTPPSSASSPSTATLNTGSTQGSKGSK